MVGFGFGRLRGCQAHRRTIQEEAMASCQAGGVCVQGCEEVFAGAAEALPAQKPI